MATTKSAAPASWEEFYRDYLPRMHELCREARIDDVEGVSHDIFLSLFQQNWLADFDASKSFEHDGKVYAARFDTFFSKTVRRYLLGHRDRQTRKKSREWAVGMGHHYTPETHEPITPEVESSVDYQKLVTLLAEHLAQHPLSSRREGNLSDLFEAVRKGIEATDRMPTQRALAAQYNVSRSCMVGYLERMQHEIASCLDAA